jgi:hypothetical protein
MQRRQKGKVIDSVLQFFYRGRGISLGIAAQKISSKNKERHRKGRKMQKAAGIRFHRAIQNGPAPFLGVPAQELARLF